MRRKIGQSFQAPDAGDDVRRRPEWEHVGKQRGHLQSAGGDLLSALHDPPDEIVEWQKALPISGRTYCAGPRSVVMLVAG